MALGTALAVLGSAAVGALASSSAAGKAADASQYATDQSAQVQREALQTAQQNTATSRAAGDLATTALASRLGLIPTGSTLAAGSGGATTGGSGTGQPAGAYSGGVPYSATQPQAGQPDWNAYIAANPDVKAAWDSTAKNNPAYGGDITKWAQDQYQQWGKADGRAAPPSLTQQQAVAAGAPQTDVQLSPSAQVPSYTRPTDQTAPAAYTPTTYTAGDYTRPEYDKTLDVSMDAFNSSPEAAVAANTYKTLANGTNAQFSATGALQSGAAAKALADRAQANALNYYGQFAGRTTNQFNTDRGRFDTNFNFDTGLKSQNALAFDQLNSQNGLAAANLARSDYQYGLNRADQNYNVDRAYGTDLALNNRTYETGRYDNQTNNLFNLSSLGQGAANNYTSAAQNSANNTSNALFSNAANQGNAAISQANQLNGLLSTGVNALAYYNAKKAN